jgi:hypothetical protein
MEYSLDLKNTTGNVANDYHVRLEADANIDTSVLVNANGFPSIRTRGNGTKAVRIDWSGATINPGGTISEGFGIVGAKLPPNLRITESYWTLGGLKVVALTSGRLATGDFNGTVASDPWGVVRVSLFDDLTGTDQIGTEWIEGQVNPATLTNYAIVSNQTSDGPIFASWAFRLPGAFVPLDELNSSLGGFGPQTPIQELAAAPEPSSVVLFGLGGACCVLACRCRKRKQQGT